MMKKMKIVIFAAAFFLALLVFEERNGIDVVQAGDLSSNVTPSTGGTPPPTPPSSVPSSRPSKVEEEVQEVPAPIGNHKHSFEYVRIQDATETEDGLLQLQCSCGAAGETIREAGSAAGLFIKDVIQKISNAPENGTVTVDTEIWCCYNRKVMDALSQRPDVTLVTNYRYEHVDYTVTIPAGYDVETLLDENGYCGFRYLDQVLGESN